MELIKDRALTHPSLIVGEYGCGVPKFSWGIEIRHLLSSNFLSIICWPVFTFKQRHLTESNLLKTCQQLPGFSSLWKTIQKGSFAYNTLLLGIVPLKSNSNITDLADITTLTLFFGDEFIDGVCAAAGKHCIEKMFRANPVDFYVRVKQEGNSITVNVDFERIKKLSPQVFDAVNDKYGITYGELYKLLQSFFAMINYQLLQFPLLKRQRIAGKIADVCNNCLDSYKHDVLHKPVQDAAYKCSGVFTYHELKTRLMQKKLLELRCLLADKEHIMHCVDVEGWLDIMSVVQIYDDMQDVVVDDGVQDNLVLYTARRYYKQEWNWFVANKRLLGKSKHAAFLVSLNMPLSINACLSEAGNYIRLMNWEQQKIMHYLLRKNWFVPVRGNCGIAFDGCGHLTLSAIYNHLEKKMEGTTEETLKSHAIETCFHYAPARKKLLQQVDFTTAYQLRYNLLLLSKAAKASIFNRVYDSLRLTKF